MIHHTAPLSNYHIFRPANTGSPRWDLYDHISGLPQTARMDFEDHSLAGGLIIRVEPDLGSAAEREAEAKIISVPYAARVFGNTQDAAEFVRCVNLIAGADARPFNLQVVASYFYGEARRRPVREVLKEMALLALEMTAVTATEEERQFGEVSETLLDLGEADSQLSQSDRRALSQRRAAEVLGETEDETSVFELELRALSRFRVRTSGFAYDEFAAYLTGCESLLETADEVDALYDSFESVYEQYDEDHVVRLHMSDGEHVRCVGALDDDVDADSLPEESRHLARELYRLYTRGFPLRDRGEECGAEGITLPYYQRDPRTRERIETSVVVYGLDTWLDAAVDAVYHERTIRTVRHLISVPMPRRPSRAVRMEVVVPYQATVGETRRGVTTRTRERRHALRRVEVSLPASRLHEQTSTVEVCPHAAEREQTRAVLEVLLERMKSDCHTRGLHASAVYRELAGRLAPTTDTGHVAKLKKVYTISSFGQTIRQIFQLQQDVRTMVTCRILAVQRVWQRMQQGIFDPQQNMRDLEDYLRNSIGRAAENRVAYHELLLAQDAEFSEAVYQREIAYGRLARAEEAQKALEEALTQETRKPPAEQQGVDSLLRQLADCKLYISQLTQQIADYTKTINAKMAQYGVKLDAHARFGAAVQRETEAWTEMTRLNEETMRSLGVLFDPNNPVEEVFDFPEEDYEPFMFR